MKIWKTHKRRWYIQKYYDIFEEKYILRFWVGKYYFELK